MWHHLLKVKIITHDFLVATVAGAFVLILGPVHNQLEALGLQAEFAFVIAIAQ